MQLSCATTGAGLYEGLDWLSDQIRDVDTSEATPTLPALPLPRLPIPMALLASKLKARVLMVGLDASGKTTILNKLKLVIYKSPHMLCKLVLDR